MRTTTQKQRSVLLLNLLLLSLLAFILPAVHAEECSFKNFCPDGVTKPNTVVEGAGSGLTCQTIAVGISLGMVPEEQCAQLLFAEMFCCPKEEEVPPDCFLCGGSSDDQVGMAHLDRLVDGESCQEINQKLQLNPREKSCNAWKEVYQTMKSVDTEAYCGCESSPTPPNQCQLCGSSTNNLEIAKLLDPLDMVPTDGYSNMTCIELLDYASHVTSMDACGKMATPEIQAACCAGSAAASRYFGSSRLWLWGVSFLLAMGFIVSEI